MGEAARRVSQSAVEQVSIDSIEIGFRRRQKLGKVQRLASSIERRGLLHPIVIDDEGVLVAGERRLAACKSLGWRTIPARRIGTLTEDELRELELDENEEREALLTYEKSRQRLAEIRKAKEQKERKAAEAAERERKTVELRQPSCQKSRGRPASETSRRSLARETGVSHTTVQKLEKHVAVAEQYPFMQRPEWRQAHVLTAAEALEGLPKAERGRAANIVDQDAIPPKDAIKIIRNLATMEPDQRKEIYADTESSDKHRQAVALSHAAALPPPPEPALFCAGEAQFKLKQALRICRTERAKPLLSRALGATEEALAVLKDAQAEARRRAGHGG